jgi:NADH-quinone oxidoreductase subunit K
LFIIVIAAAEVGLALAIVLMVFRTHGHIDVDRLRALADRDDDPAVEPVEAFEPVEESGSSVEVRP